MSPSRCSPPMLTITFQFICREPLSKSNGSVKLRAVGWTVFGCIACALLLGLALTCLVSLFSVRYIILRHEPAGCSTDRKTYSSRVPSTHVAFIDIPNNDLLPPMFFLSHRVSFASLRPLRLSLHPPCTVEYIHLIFTTTLEFHVLRSCIPLLMSTHR